MRERLAELDERWESWTQGRSARRLAWTWIAVTVGLWIVAGVVVSATGDNRIDTGFEKFLFAAALLGGMFTIPLGITLLVRSSLKIEGGTPARSAVGTFLTIATVFGAALAFRRGLAGVVLGLVAGASVGLGRYFYARRTEGN